MGCWNGTCGLSQLPLFAQDKVKLLILIKLHPEYKGIIGYCYPEDLWSPFMFPISGEYNDYGALENIIKDENTDYIVSSFKESSNIKDISRIEDVVKNIERGEVTFNDHEMSFMMISEQVYNTAIKIASKNRNIDDYCRSDDTSSYLESLEKCMALIEKRDVRVISKVMKLLKTNHSIFIPNYGNFIFNTTQTIDDLAINSLHLHHFMFLFRKGYQPQFGAGSQAGDCDLYMKFFSEMVKITKNIIKKEKGS